MRPTRRAAPASVEDRLDLGKTGKAGRTGPSVLGSVQARLLEEISAVGGDDAELARRAVAHHRERDLGAGGTDPPDAAERAGEVFHRRAVDLEDDVARMRARLVRRPALGEA